MKPRFLLCSCEPYYFLDEGNRYDEEEEDEEKKKKKQILGSFKSLAVVFIQQIFIKPMECARRPC